MSDFTRKEDDLRMYKKKVDLLQEGEKLLTIKYNKEVNALNDKLIQERDAAKKGLHELSEMSKRQEKMFTNSIYEIESLMNQLTIDKKGKSTNNLTQLMLNKLAEDKAMVATSSVSASALNAAKEKSPERIEEQKGVQKRELDIIPEPESKDGSKAPESKSDSGQSESPPSKIATMTVAPAAPVTRPRKLQSTTASRVSTSKKLTSRK